MLFHALRRAVLPLASTTIAACGADPVDALAPADSGSSGADAAVDEDTSADDAATASVDAAPDAASTPSDASPPTDTTADADAAAPDGTQSDAATVLDSTGAADASPTLPLPGFGAIVGPCGFIDTELTDPNPSFIINNFDFGVDPYDHPADLGRLTPDGQTMMAAGNAGGSSILSEILAMEYLIRCEGGRLLETETAIDYDVADTKRTDILVELDAQRVGVSVTRAVGWPRESPWPLADADRVLRGKLEGILESTANVSDNHRWTKQILHVFAYSADHAATLEAAWSALPAELRADTVVIATITDGADAFVYDSFRP
jgi:hypothetical protein